MIFRNSRIKKLWLREKELDLLLQEPNSSCFTRREIDEMKRELKMVSSKLDRYSLSTIETVLNNC